MKKPKYKTNQKAADRAVQFFANLKHTKGEWAGKPFILAPWQEQDIIRPLFGTLNPDGTRQYRTAFIFIPKKNGKSELAAGIALYLLFADGEIGGEVYSAAADRDQASIVFNIAEQMVRLSPALLRRCRPIPSTKRIVVYETSSFYRALSADVGTKEGVNPSGVIFDELHTQKNRSLWDLLTNSSSARRQPLVVAITTAGVGKESICYEQYKRAKQIIKGTRTDPTFFAYIKEVPKNADWKDEKTWYIANPALGDFKKIDNVRTLAKTAMETPSAQNAFRRYHLNQWVKQEVRWIDIEKWDGCIGSVKDRSVLENMLEKMDCYAALDLASSVDIAALVLVFPSGDGFYVLPYFWVPEENILERSKKDQVDYDVWAQQGWIEATPGNVIDYKAIYNKILMLNERFAIREIAFDRWGMTQLSQDLDAAGFVMVPFGQGFQSMAAPTKELMALILSKKIWHAGNPVLRWMADNVMVKQDPAGNIKPDKSKSTEKIDGIVALVMGLDRAMRHKQAGSVYEERGLRIL